MFGVGVFQDDLDLFLKMFEFAQEMRSIKGTLSGWDVEYYLKVFYDKSHALSETCYDMNYEPRRHTEETYPLKLVEMNVKQGLLESNPFRRRAWEYRTYKINELMGMSFLEWISLPTAHLDMLLDDIRTEAKQQQEHAEKQKRELERMNVDGPLPPDQHQRMTNFLMANSKAMR